MTDPGAFSTLQSEEKSISAVLITHEHSDHLHVESLKRVLDNNPNALVITNAAVGELLKEAGIDYKIVEDGESLEVRGSVIRGFGNLHAEIYEDMSRVQNTGYMVDDLCYPGDAFENPNCKVDILALPVAGPWMRMKDAFLYAKLLKPRISFPVHDAFIQDWATFMWKWPGMVLPKFGVEFKKLEIGKEENL